MCYAGFFFLSRTAGSEWRVNKMSGNGLGMACDLCLCLHINEHIFYQSRRKESTYVDYSTDRQTRDFSVVYVYLAHI